MPGEQLHRARSEPFVLPVLLVEHLQKMGDQPRDLLPPLAEGGHADLDHVESIVEVLAELAAAQGELEIAVRGGDEADVDAEGLAPPTRQKRRS